MKKKLLIALLAITTALCCIFGFTACGNSDSNKNDKNTDNNGVTDELSTDENGITYKLSDDGTYYICTGISKEEKLDVVIADSFNNLPVKEIGKEAFRVSGEFDDDVVIAIPDKNGNYITGTTNRKDIKIKSIQIPESVTKIGDRAFFKSSDLVSVKLPENLTEIGMCAFADCSSLTSIAIPVSVNKIASDAFAGCCALESITVSGGNAVYQSVDNCLIEKESKILLSGCKNSIIPEGITEIAANAFVNCSGLTGITIPDGVTKIGAYAFSGCGSLESIIIPVSVTAIGEWAFANCYGLTGITIPDGVTKIGAYAFSGCGSLESIIIPVSVTAIGEWAFDRFSLITYKGTAEQWNAIIKVAGAEDDRWYMNGEYTIDCTDRVISSRF